MSPLLFYPKAMSRINWGCRGSKYCFRSQLYAVAFVIEFAPDNPTEYFELYVQNSDELIAKVVLKYSTPLLLHRFFYSVKISE